MSRAYMIKTSLSGPAVLREPIPGVWYTGLNEAGQYGRMAKFNGFVFTMSSEKTDDDVEVEMSDYPALYESPIRRTA